MVLTVFIVDDEPSLTELFSIFAEAIGFEVIGLASNGNSAVDAYKALDRKPDLIIMDHRMPIKNGIDASAEILALNRDQKILMASADVTIKEKAMGIGIADVITKPFEMDEFIGRMKNLLGLPVKEPS